MGNSKSIILLGKIGDVKHWLNIQTATLKNEIEQLQDVVYWLQDQRFRIFSCQLPRARIYEHSSEPVICPVSLRMDGFHIVLKNKVLVLEEHATWVRNRGKSPTFWGKSYGWFKSWNSFRLSVMWSAQDSEVNTSQQTLDFISGKSLRTANKFEQKREWY